MKVDVNEEEIEILIEQCEYRIKQGTLQKSLSMKEMNFAQKFDDT